MPEGRPLARRSSVGPAPSGLEIADQLIGAVGKAVQAVLDHSGIRFDDINARSDGLFVLGWNVRQWQPLQDDAAPLVGDARKALQRLREFTGRAALAAPDILPALEQSSSWLERLVEQPNGSLPDGAPGASIDEVRAKLDEKLEDYAAALRRLPNAHGRHERLLVADTSALIERPLLQEWALDDESWTVVLVPTVLEELDNHKHNPKTRDTAMKVIRQLEDLDSRGDTTAGVRLSGRLMYREVVRSPDMECTLQWLRADTPDDVIVASALELVWDDLTSRVAIAAADRNLRNKARFAGLQVIRASDL